MLRADRVADRHDMPAVRARLGGEYRKSELLQAADHPLAQSKNVLFDGGGASLRNDLEPRFDGRGADEVVVADLETACAGHQRIVVAPARRLMSGSQIDAEPRQERRIKTLG